ncbi:aspartate/glutamate racemase family protein [Marinospirillum perlucidum]|uniref:aspartate/glutamate racemase family protein n=1 Tax=Marinospirillum perlucidum TaxID=1982602 RepID=UPI000DF320B6|nr:aspartate/glutamate racemase family protein [Marinospirillum perlucidum]
MKTIGLLGGMSWESTRDYYTAINQGIKARLGGLHSAKILLKSVDFAEIEALQHQGNWAATATILVESARQLEAGGADFLLICTNTMHKVAPEIEAALSIPLLHLADATAQKLVAADVQRVGLLGTAFTMEQNFYKGRLKDRFGLEVLVPSMAERKEIHRVIYEELCLGEIKPESRQVYLDAIHRLAAEGAEAVILGCTEIGLLVNQQDTKVPLFDTTAIHAQAAVEAALK